MALRETDPVAWLVAHEDIRQLASRYAVYMDMRDIDKVVELFVPDVKIGKSLSGRQALKENMNGMLRDLKRSILQVTNHVIDVIDDVTATGIVSCRGEIEPVDSPGKWVVQQIQYHDNYAKVDGKWLFVRRRHMLWYGADMLQRPIGLPDANWPANHSGKGELPEWFDTWRQWQS